MEDIPHKLLNDIQQRRKFCEATDFLKSIGVRSHHLKLRCPVYALTSSYDTICTPKAMQRLLNDFIHAPIKTEVVKAKHLNIPKIGHAGFFNKKCEESLWYKVSDWFDESLNKHGQTELMMDKFYC
jgi:predicted alpha/beta hydrolase